MKPDSREAAKLARQDAILNGPVFSSMMQLALPVTLVLIAQTSVNVAEAYYFSFLGTSALTGVALVFPVWMLAAGGIGGGVASAVARVTGADDVYGASRLRSRLLSGISFPITSLT